jgi:hypothetical protein
MTSCCVKNLRRSLKMNHWKSLMNSSWNLRRKNRCCMTGLRMNYTMSRIRCLSFFWREQNSCWSCYLKEQTLSVRQKLTGWF